MTERFKAILEVHLLLVANDALLLIRRAHTGYEDGSYSVPAGHMDGGETVKAAMIREASEEVGVQIEPEDLQVVGVVHRRTERDERISFFLAAQRWQGEVRNCEPHKCDDVRWCRFDALPPNTIPYVRKAIANFQCGLVFDSFGWSVV